MFVTFLKFAHPEEYTRHCFKRCAALLVPDSGVDVLAVKGRRSWKSNSSAEGYIKNWSKII